jgi:uncharacterized phosphosugar-binding protein
MTTSPGIAYLELIERMLARLRDDEWPRIREAAGLVADSLGSGGTVHVFGSGHSHMLAEEMFYRAGGLVRVRPILFDGLMLHPSALISTSLERLPQIADALLADHEVAAGDVLIVASNSGSNAVSSQMVRLVQRLGVRVIAITSLRHATSSAARANDLPRLHEIAEVVIDNGGVVGDAAFEIQGFHRMVAATSTVIGAAIVNAVVAEAVQILVDRGTPPEVYTSSNLEGGDEVNASLIRAANLR